MTRLTACPKRLAAWSRVCASSSSFVYFSAHVILLSPKPWTPSPFSLNFSSFLTHFYAQINHSNQYPCISLSLNTSQSSFLHLFFIISLSSLSRVNNTSPFLSQISSSFTILLPKSIIQLIIYPLLFQFSLSKLDFIISPHKTQNKKPNLPISFSSNLSSF